MLRLGFTIHVLCSTVRKWFRTICFLHQCVCVRNSMSLATKLFTTTMLGAMTQLAIGTHYHVSSRIGFGF